MKFDKHIFFMIIGCVLPLLFIFLAPAFGISSSVSIFIFIVAMFTGHLLMPMNGQSGHSHGNTNENQSTDKQLSKTENHEHHQH